MFNSYIGRMEWDRVIHLMMDMLPERAEEFNEKGKVNDMQSLLNLGRSGISGVLWSYTNKYVAQYLSYERFDEGDLVIKCADYSGKLAVHLSHSANRAAYGEDVYPVENVTNIQLSVAKRDEAALVLMEDYKNHCMQGMQFNHRFDEYYYWIE